MAKATFWQKGETIDYVNLGDTLIQADTVVLYGSRLGIAGYNIAPGETGTLHMTGVFSLPKDYGDSGKALTAGQDVYWDSEADCIKAAMTSEESAVPGFATAVHGFAVASAFTTDRTALIKINA